MVKYFMIGLLPKLLQQVKYKGVDTLEDVIRIVEKNFELVWISMIPPMDMADSQQTSLRASSSTSTLHPSNTLLKMEATMK